MNASGNEHGFKLRVVQAYLAGVALNAMNLLKLGNGYWDIHD
jgi:hypothetical protein